MIKQLHALTIAQFNSLESLDQSEIEQADLVQILGHHPGGIYHSAHMRWKCFLNDSEDARCLIRSSKELHTLESNSDFFLSQGYSIAIKKMNQADHYAFKTLYEQTTLQKQRAVEYDFDDKILGRILVGIPVYCVGLFLQSSLESALIFTVSKANQAVVSFGAKKRFDRIRGGIGGVLEWKLLQYCAEQHIGVIDHGRNPNPIGVLTGSGLFEFKARYGNSAFPEGEWLTTYVQNPRALLSDLVFVSVIDSEVGYIVVTDHAANEVRKKYLTNQVSKITVENLNSYVRKSASSLSALLHQQTTVQHT